MASRPQSLALPPLCRPAERVRTRAVRRNCEEESLYCEGTRILHRYARSTLIHIPTVPAVNPLALPTSSLLSDNPSSYSSKKLCLESPFKNSHIAGEFGPES